jgi:hypothetical protein
VIVEEEKWSKPLFPRRRALTYVTRDELRYELCKSIISGETTEKMKKWISQADKPESMRKNFKRWIEEIKEILPYEPIKEEIDSQTLNLKSDPDQEVDEDAPDSPENICDETSWNQQTCPPEKIRPR